jgi:YgiT-type zinc finger domain-containing protein
MQFTNIDACPCGRELETTTGTTTQTIEAAPGTTLTLTAIPCTKCVHCGEAFISLPTMQRMASLVGLMRTAQLGTVTRRFPDLVERYADRL